MFAMEERAQQELILQEEPQSVPGKTAETIFYPITPNRLTTYVHYQQFVPVLILTIAALACIFCFCDEWLWVSVFAVMVAFFTLYRISTIFATRRTNSVKYSREGNTISVERSYFGTYSKKVIELEQVTRISLMRTPLMKFCDVWAIEFVLSSNVRTRIYGIRDAANVHRQLVEARARALAAVHHK